MHKFWGIFCYLGALFFLFPSILGIFHIGMVWPFLLLLYLGSWLCFPKRLASISRHFIKWLQILIVLFLSYVLILFAMMGVTAIPTTEVQGDETVIILGCQVYDEKPSVMLQNRIDVAYDYLSSHSDSVCIATGGMDDAETMTEAQCISETLQAMGIRENRIFLEDTSTSTHENLLNAGTIIAENQLNSNILIATDRFHEFRAHYYARKCELIPQSLSCKSYWLLSPSYWCREVVAITAMWMGIS